jgi:Mce-associated membrane protein
VAAAAQAAYTIVATSYEDYDAQVDEAAELMTPRFAEEYRRTADDVADAIVSSKTEVQVSVVAQGVVRADREQVQALVFLNQFVTKDGKQPVFTPYRALVTVVNTDQGWLVSDLDTK